MKLFYHIRQMIRSVVDFIRERLSLRLGMLIICIVTVVFSLFFGFMFYHAKRYVRQVAIDRATQLLENTVVRINGIMDETETVTNHIAATTPHRLHPDSLLAITRKTVIDHSFLTGLAISMEPYYFPEMGRYYSAYSLRQDDTITTVREGPFEYFEKVWYKSPRTKGSSCWVDGYDDYNEGTLSSKDILTSYCCPMRDAQGQYVGSVTASLTLKWLSQAVSDIKPYPHSSAIMVGRTGIYLVHSDTAKLFRETIFSDAAEESRNDINKLGKEMLAGRSGMMQTIVDGKDSYIFYRPLERTGWSIAIVCPESDVFYRYDRLLVTVWVIIGVGLLLLLLFCYQTIRRAIGPVKELSRQAGRMADGHFDEVMPHNQRRDSVGLLANSFGQMQQSISKTISDIQAVNQELKQRNEELTKAYQLKVETNHLRTAFIQNMSHQIRTPLNIICGFTQVLSASQHELAEEDTADILSRMKSSADTISDISHKLYVSSQETINSQDGPSAFRCNELCQEALDAMKLQAAEDVSLSLQTEVPDTLTIRTRKNLLLYILNELLDNANKFTSSGYIHIGCRQVDEKTVVFFVCNTGIGIPVEKRSKLFLPFSKLDSFSEGIGLGLTLCRNAARQLGGDLILDETRQEDTCFNVMIPIDVTADHPASPLPC